MIRIHIDTLPERYPAAAAECFRKLLQDPDGAIVISLDTLDQDERLYRALRSYSRQSHRPVDICHEETALKVTLLPLKNRKPLPWMPE